MPPARLIQDAITKAIDYLHQHQMPNGEFCAYMSPDDPMQGWIQPISMIFPTALICHSLQAIKNNAKVEDMLTKSTVFLRYQSGRYLTWNYFTNQHPLRSICPQDVDDTAVVSSFLLTRDPSFDPAVNKQLILDNRNSKGLLYTWFGFRWKFNRNYRFWRLSAIALKNPLKSILFFYQTEAGRNDIDAVVNANALSYLGDVPETQAIIQYLVKIISDKKEDDCDTWYRNPFTIYYFFSKSYHSGIYKLEPVRQPIVERITTQQGPDGCIAGSVLNTALAACSLLNLNYSGPVLDAAIQFLLTTQKEHGEWERWLLYYGGPKKLSGYGSEELTTAVCLEALARYHRLIKD